MEIILVGFFISLALSAGALTYSLVKAERWDYYKAVMGPSAVGTMRNFTPIWWELLVLCGWSRVNQIWYDIQIHILNVIYDKLTPKF